MDQWQGQSQMLKRVLLHFYNMIPYMGFVGAFSSFKKSFKSHLKKKLFKWQFFLMHIAKDRADKSQLTVTAYIAIHFSCVSFSIDATNKTLRVMHY